MKSDINETFSNINFQDILSTVKADLQNIDWEGMSKREYEQDREYPENFSNWYPYIKDTGTFAVADIVAHQIFTWEETEVFKETDMIEKVDWNKINKILKPTLDKLKPNTLYNMKNGCFSNKFEYDICTITKDTLAEKLWKLNYQSAMFETGGYTELVIREYIPDDTSHCLTIYNGMPLRTEVRVFYNMDTKEIEYIEDYWNYEYCRNNLYTLNDKLIFDIFHNKTNIEVTNHKIELDNVVQTIQDNINTLKFDKKLTGIWSIDFMYDRNTYEIYLIDMARGFRSAYWNIDKLKPETKKELLK